MYKTPKNNYQTTCLSIVLQFYDYFKENSEKFQIKFSSGQKSLTFLTACVRIKALNRGAEEQEYSAVKQNTEDFAAEEHTADWKGYLRRNAAPSSALGIRENTRMTVTVREALFTESL